MVKTQQQETEMEKVLYETFLACETAEDVKALLDDLCTYTEAEQMAQRAKAAQLLKAGKTYAEVIAATNIYRGACGTAAAAMKDLCRS